MPSWVKKADEQLARMRDPGEQELHSGYGAVGIKGAKFTLTSKRLYIFHAGATGWSDPVGVAIDLPYITDVHLDPGAMGMAPTLIIRSRIGTFGILLAKEARKEGGIWANWILEAQTHAATIDVPRWQ